MGIDDQSETGTAPLPDTLAERAEDDFVLRSRIDRGQSSQKQAERRMHLRAFDYWHALHGDKPLPFFGDLTADGLQPFKRNCLLLELHEADTIVRFCGSELAPLLGGVLVPGTTLSGAKLKSFANALLDRFAIEDGRQEAAEFEFVDDPLECRGILLPFSARGAVAEFVMVVVNHRQRSIGIEEREKISLEDRTGTFAAAHDTGGQTSLSNMAAECEVVGRSVVHPGAGTRESLYAALAEAYRFHIEASRDPMGYRRFLREQGIRQQRRAPFTPALKITFGKDYEKTRLAEYAAALSYAARHEVGPDNLANFLRREPGGIKGCVARERAFKRGDNTSASTAKLLQAGRALAPKSLEALAPEQEFSLVLVRRGTEGDVHALTTVRSSRHMIEKAINQALKQQE